MATYSREKFVRDVLLELRMVDAAEAPEAEDAATIGEKTQQKFEELYEDGLLPFDIEGEIPARYMIPLVYVVARECAGSYPVGDRAMELESKGIDGLARLWKMRDKFAAGEPATAEYF